MTGNDLSTVKSRSERQLASALFEKIWGDQYDWSGDHMSETPDRWIKMMKELTTPEEFDFTTFPADNNEMVVLQNIPFSSLCAHHMIPFIGVAHIAYIPSNKIVGLSKLPRTVNYFARSLTVQEDLTTMIANYLDQQLHPLGVAVVMVAEHLCMSIRGVQAQGVKTTTSAMYGAFADHEKQARSEFLSLIRS